MADPARYYVDARMNCDGDLSTAELIVTRAPSGEWIKYKDFLDYKAGQRNSASLQTNTKLGMEVIELRHEVEHLKTCVKTLQDAALLYIRERKSQSTSAKDSSSKP